MSGAPTQQTSDGSSMPAAAEPRPVSLGAPTWPQRVLRLPLLWKLVFLDLLITLSAFGIVRGAPPEQSDDITIMAFILTLAVNAGLVYIALLPLRRLEEVAARVARGVLDARVSASPLADKDMARIGETFNQLLDTLIEDRARVRALAGQVIRAGDQERASIARELHDSTAQALGALDLLLTAAIREGLDPATAERLRVMQTIVDETWRDVRALSHTIHPRVLDDLGLPAALEWLARLTRDQADIEIKVSADAKGAALPLSAASVLYRVAQESVRNAVRHANPRQISITLWADPAATRLTVSDDGHGFDMAAAAKARSGMGIFIMRERIELVDGRLEISSQPGYGTSIRAAVPLGTMAP